MFDVHRDTLGALRTTRANRAACSDCRRHIGVALWVTAGPDTAGARRIIANFTLVVDTIVHHSHLDCSGRCFCTRHILISRPLDCRSRGILKRPGRSHSPQRRDYNGSCLNRLGRRSRRSDRRRSHHCLGHRHPAHRICSLNRCNYLRRPVGKTHRMLRKILRQERPWAHTVRRSRGGQRQRHGRSLRFGRLGIACSCRRRNRAPGRRGYSRRRPRGYRRTHDSGYRSERQRHHMHPGRVHLHHYTLYIVHRWWGYRRGARRSAHSVSSFAAQPACSFVSGCIKPTSDTGAPIAVWVSFVAFAERVIGLASGVQAAKAWQAFVYFCRRNHHRCLCLDQRAYRRRCRNHRSPMELALL